jgi:hypothetical protein
VLLYDSIWGTWFPYFAISGLATFGVSALLLALRLPLSLSLLVGPAIGLGLVWLIDQTDTPTETGDRVVLIGACVTGSMLAAWPIPYARWVYRSFRNAERQLLEADRNDAAT